MKVRRKKKRWMPQLVGSCAAAAVLALVISLNTVEGLAVSLEGIPVLGKVVSVLTVRTFEVEDAEHGYEAEIQVPEIGGTGDGVLEGSLNQAYLEQAQQLYDSFLEEMGELEEGQIANRALAAGYQVIVDDGELLVIRRYVVETAGSSMERVTYDTLDIERGLLLTLPGLFSSGEYRERIGAEILRQMEEQQAADEGIVYFQEEFAGITESQTFYINGDRKLVIAFDEYEVAPGYMGAVEFVIPTEAIADLLAGDGYIL